MVNAIPRPIPPQPWFLRSYMISAVGGIMPFGAVFTELFFIMSSMWQRQFYSLFGFVALIVVVLGVTCAEVSIVLTYFKVSILKFRFP